METLQPLCQTVQHNCDISDARHARDYSLCVYLLKMREYYRWDHGFGLTDSLPQAGLSDWLSERERMWEAVARDDYASLPLPEAGAARVPPFESELANRALIPHGVVYSGGYGPGMKPLFFLARLSQRREREGFEILLTDTEYARDLSAPPALLQGRRIYVRLDALRRWLWEKAEEWQSARPGSAMHRVRTHYGFDRDPAQAVERLLQAELESVVDHEVGEGLAGDQLGPGWEDLLRRIAGSPAEFWMRAVRDHLADALVTLPQLLGRDDPAGIDFYVANLTGLRRELFPELYERYRDAPEARRVEALAAAAAGSREHWIALAKELMEIGLAGGAQAPLAARLRERCRAGVRRPPGATAQ